MPDLRVVVEENPKREDIKAVTDGLDEYNIAQTKRDDAKVVAIFLRDEKENLVGGLYGWTWFGWLDINYLWIIEEHRKQDWGTKLINMAEEMAKKRGCKGSILNTFSFQAPEFYKRLGYEVYGVLENYPEGHQRYFLRKRLQ